MTIDLKTATSEQISIAVTECVAGYTKPDYQPFKEPQWFSPTGQSTLLSQLPKFATSADAVLPLLEKLCISFTWKSPSAAMPGKLRTFTVEIEAPTFPLAACVALLRAHGVEVIS
jgi:hypothetical protein